jgi:hypothetical protein
MQMRDNKVGVVNLKIERDGTQHDACHAAQHQNEKEPQCEPHRRLQIEAAGPECREPAKICTTDGMAIIRLAAVKKLLSAAGMLVANM